MTNDNLKVDWSKLSFIAQDSLLSAPVKIDPFQRVMVSISGGSDSDIVIDLMAKTVKDMSKLHFVFFDTGLEYQATKDHLVYLEEKYGIQIERLRPKKPLPTCSREFGEPFISKLVSEYMMRLQRHGFQWEDGSYEELLVKYPKCTSALKWWCNAWGEGSSFNISRNKWLKEFIQANPPQFRISNKCCQYVKKKPAIDYKKEKDIDLSITGLRKAEGGVRAKMYKTCFTKREGEVSDYRPIWWYTDEDKKSYEDACGIVHSECYIKYGLKRTGCAGCPFGRNFEDELKVIQEFEPKLYKAVNKVFGNSYEYTRRYREFAKEMNAHDKYL